jgi:hypothetical protein
MVIPLFICMISFSEAKKYLSNNYAVFILLEEENIVFMQYYKFLPNTLPKLIFYKFKTINIIKKVIDIE